MQYALLLYEFLSNIRLFSEAVMCVVNDLSVGHVACNLNLMMSIVVERDPHLLLIVIVFFFVISIAIVIRIIFCFIVDVEHVVAFFVVDQLTL